MKENYPLYVAVILDLAVDQPFDYGVLPDQIASIHVGSRVEVPVKGSKKTGFVIQIKEHSDFPSIRPIIHVFPEMQSIQKELIDLALWMSRYYSCPLNQIFKMMIPSVIRKEVKQKEQYFVTRGQTREQLQDFCSKMRNRSPKQAAILDIMLKVKKGILLTELLEKSKSTRSSVQALVEKGYLALEIIKGDQPLLFGEEYFPSRPKILSNEQMEAYEKIVEGLKENIFRTHLIHGITGSGKTEVYLQTIEKALELNKGVIVLVPEISLTTQMVERFKSRFEGQLAVLHHRLSPGERYREWVRIRQGEARIVIGARSAIFSPVGNLGLIIVDEEHELTYKQSDESPRYHARDAAVMRGKLGNFMVILGSATPSLESYYNATQGKYHLSKLGTRADSARIPLVHLVDMRQEFAKAKGYTIFSDLLLKGIQERVEKGEQAILFLNRRGYHTSMLCQDCGHTAKCPHCELALTYHDAEKSISCHLCGYTISPPPIRCQKCQKTACLKFKGVGTEQVEKALHAVIKGLRTIRMDADTTKHKGSHQRLLREFATGKGDILIGTQMVAKGLHFPQVTLVGILNADSSLNIPDFRASENAFQVITQVSGRAGRGSMPGEVIIQTAMPENQTIHYAANQDYEGFYKEEIEIRKMFQFPPFTRLVKIVFSGPNEKETFSHGSIFRERLVAMLPSVFEFHPIVPSGYSKVKGNFRFQFLIKSSQIAFLNKQLEVLKKEFKIPTSIKMIIDVDPASTFF